MSRRACSRGVHFAEVGHRAVAPPPSPSTFSRGKACFQKRVWKGRLNSQSLLSLKQKNLTACSSRNGAGGLVTSRGAAEGIRCHSRRTRRTPGGIQVDPSTIWGQQDLGAKIWLLSEKALQLLRGWGVEEEVVICIKFTCDLHVVLLMSKGTEIFCPCFFSLFFPLFLSNL